MHYWWVNQNQTYEHEFAGGYLWSPKRKSNGHRNPFYEFMREVAPGDLIYSFAGSRIAAYGIARSHAYEAPKPIEFGAAGRNWDDIGWRVDVSYQGLDHPLRPADWIEALRPFLPKKYSPLLPDGRGSQSVYLTALPSVFALKLAELIGGELLLLARSELVREVPDSEPNPETLRWEEHLRSQIETDSSLTETDREALVMARRGQGLFRKRVQEIESCCRVTRVNRPEHLRASHCKPWRDASHQERLNGDNGLLLTPSIDHLFDRGFISFRDDGRLLVSPVAHHASLGRMGVPVDAEYSTGPFRASQTQFLQYHRDAVFLRSHVTPLV